jgi:hypothetical protein
VSDEIKALGTGASAVTIQRNGKLGLQQRASKQNRGGDGALRQIVVCRTRQERVARPSDPSPVIFRRRPPANQQSQLIVTTDVMRRMPSNMPAPKGPSLPMSDLAPRAGSVPTADITAAVRDSGTVIAFMSAGASRGNLSTRVYDVITSADGCGLGRCSSIGAFAEQFCDTAEGKRRLVNALAVHRPTTDPTALLTRLSITAWVRTVGLAAQTQQTHDAVRSAHGGLPDWHIAGDL